MEGKNYLFWDILISGEFNYNLNWGDVEGFWRGIRLDILIEVKWIGRFGN